jgi:D-aminopeptidase
VVRDALVAADVRGRRSGQVRWSLPVVGETWDGMLNDIDGQHVRAEHLWSALEGAADGPVPEGNVGGGTGMVCHEFKGGIGTASRVLPPNEGGFTVGVLVQSNYGRRERLTIDGVPVGRAIPLAEVSSPYDDPVVAESGSIIVVVATDAPLLPHQCERVAQRAGLGIARTGGVGAHSSGDFFVCFATGNPDVLPDPEDEREDTPRTTAITMLADPHITPLFEAAVDATEEAIVNALLAARTMTGRDGVTAHALPRDRLLEVMARHGRGPSAR